MTPAARPTLALRQLAWFLLSIVVPCVVLVGLGIRIIVQQEELADKHAADERRLQLSDFERAVVSRLDRLRQQAVRSFPSASSPDPAMAFFATVRDNRLILPWDERTADPSLHDPAFVSVVNAAEHEEFVTGHLDRAERLLRTALQPSASTAQIAHATLLLARVLVKRGQADAAEAVYDRLLHTPIAVTDDQGVPFAVYAIQHLASRGTGASDERRAAIDAALDAAARADALPPVAAYLLRDIETRRNRAAGAASSPSSRFALIERRIAESEHALALQRDFATFETTWRGSPDAWVGHGTPVWLVGGAVSGSAHFVIAVRADAVEAAVANSSFTLTTGASGEILGDRMQGVRAIRSAASPAPVPAPGVQRAFYVALVVIVLSTTLFGGYLQWRDARRERQLAALRSQFVSSVSHELRTPLTAIRMFAETLRLGRLDESTRDEYLDTIVSESERLTRLLNNVLDFSKMEQGRRTYRREAAPLARVVRTAARAMTNPLAQQGFTLRVDADESIVAEVDADAIEQAILNLLANAMKYSGAGREIELRLTRDGSYAVIAVRDYGIGIAKPEQARIFDKFYRAPTPENQRIPGTGLGLTLVDHIVQAHDGRIEVESAPGEGSTFSIRLPARHATAPVEIEATS